MDDTDEEFVVIASRLPASEADMLRIALESGDIAVRVQDDIVSATLPLEQYALNAARLSVPRSQAERARKVLQQMGMERTAPPESSQAAGVYVRTIALFIVIAAVGGALRSGLPPGQDSALMIAALCITAAAGTVLWTIRDLRRLNRGRTLSNDDQSSSNTAPVDT